MFGVIVGMPESQQASDFDKHTMTPNMHGYAVILAWHSNYDIKHVDQTDIKQTHIFTSYI